MRSLIGKTVQRMLSQGMIGSADDALFYGRDDEIVSNRPTVDADVRTLFDRLPVASLLFVTPAAPFGEILRSLGSAGQDRIEPRDGESALLLRDIPVVDPGDRDALLAALARRKGCILRDGRIAARGTVSADQAFVVASAIRFSAFVKRFLDFLSFAARNGRHPPFSPAESRRLRAILSTVPRPDPGILPPLPTGTDAEVDAAMDACGRKTVEAGLVDAFFGNISWCDGDRLAISQTGSFLDELPGHIDRIPLDGSSTAGITASSETGAHLAICRETGRRAILHGHPRFSVVLSMHCREAGCPGEESCGTTCPVPRWVDDVPIVPGETGAGRYALARTVPPAVRGRRGAIVHGHGVFCAGDSFPEALSSLAAIERLCLDRYRELAGD